LIQLVLKLKVLLLQVDVVLDLCHNRLLLSPVASSQGVTLLDSGVGCLSLAWGLQLVVVLGDVFNIVVLFIILDLNQL
jgi:hypothetical protein